MTRTRLLALAAIGGFVALLWLGGESVPSSWARFVSFASLFVVGLDGAYERWLWAKLPSRWRRPDLRGTWRGTLTSHWIDPDTSTAPPPKVCYLVIGQTASTLEVAMLTDESRSESAVADLTVNGAGWTLRYLYRGQPRISVDHRSTAHHGGATLNVDSVGARLEGHYWTDRNSRGELRFGSRAERRVATFAEAEGLGLGSA